MKKIRTVSQRIDSLKSNTSNIPKSEVRVRHHLGCAGAVHGKLKDILKGELYETPIFNPRRNATKLDYLRHITKAGASSFVPFNVKRGRSFRK